MPRSNKVVKKRVSLPDSLYHSPLVTRIINKLMERGKRLLAEKIVYQALAEVKDDKKEALEVLKTAVNQASPKLEVRPRRVGGATYQVPMPVRHDRAESLAIRWILAATRSRQGLPMAKKLSLEIKEAAAGVGSAVRKRETMHRMGEANRAFAHFRW